MAVVQLVDLSEECENAAEFRFYKKGEFKLSAPCRSLTGPKGLQFLVKNSSQGFDKNDWNVSKSDWPNRNSDLCRWNTGLPVRIFLAIAWSQDGVAGAHAQPPEKFWIIHPANGEILAVNSNIEVLKSDVSKFVGGTSAI